MSLILDGNGFSYTVPGTVDLREVSQRTRLGDAVVVGRRGGIVQAPSSVGGSLELVLSGYLTEGTPSELRQAFAGFAEALHSGDLSVTDTDLDRVARARLKGLSYERVGGSSGSTLRVAARLAVLDGAWSDAESTHQSGTITLLNAATVTRNLVFHYAGSVPAAPTIRVTLNAGAVWTPEIRRMGGNLLANPSFERGLSVPESWTVDAGSPLVVSGSGRLGGRAVSVGVADRLRTSVPVNGGETHTFSGYLRTASSGTADVAIAWRDSSGALLGTNTAAPSATSAWTRFVVVCQGVPNGTSEARVLLGAASGVVEYDDVQLEQTGSASPFGSAELVSFTRDGALDYSTGDRGCAIDMARGTARRWNASHVEADDLAATNGRFFELEPDPLGVCHLHFAAPTGGTLGVEVHYRARHA